MTAGAAELERRIAALADQAEKVSPDEARRAVAETGGRGLLLAPGCSVPPRAKDINLAAMVSAMAA